MTKHIVLYVRIGLWIPRDLMAKAVREVTTIQLTPATRDRLYRLKFRATYDEFLNELCDLFESANHDAQK